MKYIIDTDTMSISEYKGDTETSTGARQIKMLELLRTWTGAHEWDGIVSGIQKWYYGYVSKTSWCATTMSYLLTAVGINVKRENVASLLDYARTSNIGHVYEKSEIPKTIREGDILFFLWGGGTMTAKSSKHVTMCNMDTCAGSIHCLGGNQSDGITEQMYARNCLYAVWRID